MRVQCDVEETEVTEGDRTGSGICVICRRCDEEVFVFGTTGRSIRRALVMLKEDCPMGEENYYSAEGDDEDRD